MENIKIVQGQDGLEHVIIDHGNEQFTSMPKSEYDKQQAEQSTPIVINEAETI